MTQAPAPRQRPSYLEPMTLAITMHEAFPAREVEAVRRLAREYDESAQVEANYATKSVTVTLIIIVAGLKVIGGGFLNRAGEDAYDSLKSFVQRLRLEVESESQVVLEDAGLQIILGPSTPAEALLALPENVREAAGEAGELFWDEDSSSWVAPEF